jgi:hypothetical protein
LVNEGIAPDRAPVDTSGAVADVARPTGGKSSSTTAPDRLTHPSHGPNPAISLA